MAEPGKIDIASEYGSLRAQFTSSLPKVTLSNYSEYEQKVEAFRNNMTDKVAGNLTNIKQWLAESGADQASLAKLDPAKLAKESVDSFVSSQIHPKGYEQMPYAEQRALNSQQVRQYDKLWNNLSELKTDFGAASYSHSLSSARSTYEGKGALEGSITPEAASKLADKLSKIVPEKPAEAATPGKPQASLGNGEQTINAESMEAALAAAKSLKSSMSQPLVDSPEAHLARNNPPSVGAGRGGAEIIPS